MTTPTYRPLTDEDIDVLQNFGGDPEIRIRRLAEQARRANRLAEAVRSLRDFAEEDPTGERRLLREIRIGEALAAYLGEI